MHSANVPVLWGYIRDSNMTLRKKKWTNTLTCVSPNLSIYQKTLFVCFHLGNACWRRVRVNAVVCAFKKQNKATKNEYKCFSVTAGFTEKIVTVLQYVAGLLFLSATSSVKQVKLYSVFSYCQSIKQACTYRRLYQGLIQSPIKFTLQCWENSLSGY